MEAGHIAVLHYDTCHRARWRLDPPEHGNTVTVLGWVLTSVGILCLVAGLVLVMF